MDVDAIITLVSAVATFVVGLLAGYSKYKKAKKILKELSEALVVTYEALKDDKITEEEVKQILKEYEDVYKAIRFTTPEEAIQRGY